MLCQYIITYNKKISFSTSCLNFGVSRDFRPYDLIFYGIKFDSTMSDSSSLFLTVKIWDVEFKCSRLFINDDERLGSLKTTTDKIIENNPCYCVE